jgi:hypothetical protein
MRQILVDGARARGAQKRWAGMDRAAMPMKWLRSVQG